MEGNGVDDLYGDLSQDQYCSLATGNEDSLDIYSGLDTTPRSNGETSCSIASPQLTESMDLYEEIITEEQRSIESAQNELKKRFVAAQNQVEELRLRLQQMETQNTALNTENSCLKKNICALIKTARMEIVRKDEEIKRLSQRSGRAYTPHVNGTKDPVSTRLNSLGHVRSSGPSRAPPPIKPPGPRTDCASKEGARPAHPSPPPSSAPPSIKHPGLRIDCASKDGAPPAHPSPPPSSAPPPIKHPGPRIDCASKDAAHPPTPHPPPPPTSLPHPPPPLSSLPPRPSSPPPLPPSSPPPLPPSSPPPPLQPPCRKRDVLQHSDASDSRPPPDVDSKYSTARDCEVPLKQTDISIRKVSTDSAPRHNLLERHKQPSHKDGKYEHRRTSEERRHKNAVEPLKESQAEERSRSHKTHRESRRHDSMSRKDKHRSPEIEVDKRSAKSKSPPLESGNGTVLSAHKSKTSSKTVTEPHSKRCGRDLRHDKDGDDRSCKDLSSSRRRQEEVASSRRSLTEQSSEPLNHKRGANLSSNYRRKEERQRKDDAKRREKRSPLMETREEYEQKHKKEREERKKAPDSKEEKSTSSCQDVPPGEQKLAEIVTVEENSPNRKLSFMETLNLTLSPVKKPRGLSGSKDHGSFLPEEEVEDSSVECCDQLDMEDFCVIDEVHSDSMEINSSQSAAEINKTLMDDAKQVTSDGPLSLDPAGMERLRSGEEPSEKGDRSEAVTDLKAINETLKDSLRCDVELSKGTEDPHSPKSLDSRCASAPDSQLLKETNLQRVDVCHNVESKDLTTDACLTDSQEDTQLCCSTDRKKIPDKLQESIGLPDSCGLNINDEPPSVLISKNQPSETIAQDAVDASREEDSTAKDGKAKINQSQQLAFPNQPEGYLIQLSTSSSSSESNEKTSSLRKDGSPDADEVSSTISIEVPPQNDLACEPYAEVTLWDNAVDVSIHEQSSPPGSIAVSRVSSTTEEVLPLENLTTCSVQSLKGSRNANSCYTNNREATSSIPLLYDEESMMKTLNSLKLFPDPVSPLTSPIRITRKNQLHSQSNKPAHVKSLGKDFSTVLVDATTTHLGVNKENKNPGGFTKSMTISQTEDELEEGEILSESDEEQCPVTSQAKRPTATDQPSPQPSSRLGKRCSAKLLAASQESPKTIRKTITPSSGSPSLNRSRHKTICLPTATTSVLSTEEVMDMIGKIRHQVRKKYMKLNKTFQMSSFYGIIDNALVSFLDFVDRVNLSKFCDHADDLKSRLKNVMSNVLNKISKNGIVNRIFEQQSECLKKKLWNFVDVQLDFMFKDVRAALVSVCKAKKEYVHSSADTDEKSSKNKSTKPLSSPATITSRPKSPVNITPRPKSQLGKSPITIRSRPKSQLGKSPVTITSRPKSKLEKSPVTMTSRPKSQQKKSLMTISRPKVRQLKSPVTPISRPRVRQKMDDSNTKRTTLVGLGSRGKNIKMTFEKEEEDTSSPNISDHPSMKNTEEKTHQNTHSTTAKEATLVRRISRSDSLHDKSDYQILTEQQTSSLTFNLVTDTQMGDIFKCLLDGSDLLDTSIPAVDCHNWPVGTPRKEGPAGEPLLSITTPTKVCLPSKLIATWSAISPRKMSPSPNGKLHLPVNPVVFDESCMLEVPSGIVPSSGVFSQRSSYSILAEDLAVSLTIPSPLKSDSHLSFLQPVNREPTSAPDSVISAHFSEDALLEEEDATEQDIHLALDTDNSSCGSSDGRSREAAGPLLFHFKPHLPMQAVVMEKSNDHFIVKIRQAATSACIPPSDAENRTEMPAGEEQRSEGSDVVTPAPAVGEEMVSSSEDSSSRCPPSTETVNGKAVLRVQSEATGDDTDDCHTKTCCYPDGNEREARTGIKRKKDQKESKAKRFKEEVHSGSKQKAFKHSKERRSRTSSKNRNKASSPTVQLSPNSLSAKNIIKKKGEVVVMWTKDEDRAILLELKMRKSSRDAFSALSDKLNKTPAQIAERFGQLMKLFKKKEKMAS